MVFLVVFLVGFFKMKMYMDKSIVCQKSEKESLVCTSFIYFNNS